MRAKVVGSMTYPAILAVVGVGVTIFLVTFVVPMFQGFFDRLERTGTGLPLVTVILVSTSQFLVRYGVFVAAGAGGVGRGCCASGSSRHVGGRWSDRWKLKIPVAGQDLSRHGRGSVLSRVGDLAPQRRAAADRPADQ